MSEDVRVLIAGRSETGLQQIRQAVGGVADVRLDALLLVNGNADPLLGVNDRPDVLILHCEDGSDSLQAIARRPESERPLLLVVGDEPKPDTVKFAVRAGARDLVGLDEPKAIAGALQDLVQELDADTGHGSGITAVMNAKGGSGGTFIACNLAHIAATNSPGSTLVLDLDFQFASLPHYFDLAPKRSFLDALANAHELDTVAVEAYTAEHSSGVSVMAPIPDTVTVADFDLNERLRTLLPLLKSRYRHIVVDVPRHIDEISTPILRAADRILIVLQQSLPSVRDAVRLKTTLVREMELKQERISVVVNRHLKSGSIELDDIRDALGEDKLLLVPNHFKSVAQSIDMGVPIAELAPSSPVVRALTKIHSNLLSDGDSKMHIPPANEAIRRLKQWSPF